MHSISLARILIDYNLDYTVLHTKPAKYADVYFMSMNTTQSISRENDPCLVVIKLCDNSNVLTLAQGPLLFFIFVFMVFIHLRNQKLFQKEATDSSFVGTRKITNFFIENGNGFVKRVSFNIKGPSNTERIHF